ncbi:hypothetical protein ACGFK1_15580 [Mycobacterium sp. NPDC048908]|uniref:hypothetical protein n=1 Tax=Mycobacterium sp. NPDC048908 TaxID=3364292 RepID=UPI00371F2CF6
MGQAAVEDVDVGDYLSTAVVDYSNELSVAVPDGASTFAGVVTVIDRKAGCTCGWSGRRRMAVFLARHDGWMHAASGRCQPGVPFVR